MSMISAQIDELRKWADQLSERENEFGVVVRALVAALRDAADTILQLRDDLQRANERLADAEHDESMVWDRACKAEADNAKLFALLKHESEQTERLRELVRDYHRFAAEMCGQQGCDACGLRDEGACERGVLTARACVLGIEVDA